MQEGEANQADGHWKYKPEIEPKGTETTRGVAGGHRAASTDEAVEWTASQFIAHQKGFEWYAVLLVSTAVLAGVAYLITRDRVSAVVIIVGGLVFGFLGSHKPRVLSYRLDQSGLTVGQHFYPYSNYKSFMMVDEDHFTSISMTPLKRFMPSISMYFAPEDQDRIMAALSKQLPMQPGNSDLMSSLLRHIRF